MTRIVRIRRLNFKKIKCGKGLNDLLPIVKKNSKLEYNILTQIAVSKQYKIKDGKVNHCYNSITMDSDSG